MYERMFKSLKAKGLSKQSAADLRLRQEGENERNAKDAAEEVHAKGRGQSKPRHQGGEEL